MNRQNFDRAISRIFNFFQKKYPMTVTLDNWFSDVSFIPDEAIPDIEVAIRSMDGLPRNLPKAFREGWAKWKNANPDKIVGHQKTKCPECKGSGFLWYQLDNYSHVCRCANCENWKQDCNESTMPCHDRRELSAMGAEIHR
jgi:hypothetical protein